MKIHTSYYANIKNIPEDYILVSISGGLSESLRSKVHIQDKRLAPTYNLFQKYKNGGSEEDYIKEFQEEVLNKIDINDILREYSLKYGAMSRIVFLCYEKPEDFCHRQLVAEHIQEKYKVKVKELNFEDNNRIKGKIVL
jgi:hypothetical protein